MSTHHALLAELKSTQEYFERSTRCLEEADAGYKPTADMLSTAQQIAHVARTLDWFLEGAFRAEGFDMDFAAQERDVAKIETLSDARAWVERAFAAWSDHLATCSDQDLAVPLPPGPVMGGLPRAAVIGALVDHCAHHRGALTVYARLCGRVPQMPYMEDAEALS